MTSSNSFIKALSLGLEKEGWFFYATIHYNMMALRSVKGHCHCWKLPDLILPRRDNGSHWNVVTEDTRDFTPTKNRRDGSQNFQQSEPLIFAAINNFFHLPVEPMHRAFMSFNLMENMKPLYLQVIYITWKEQNRV